MSRKAAQVYLEMLEMTRKTSCGGLLLHRQVANAYERFAWNGVAELAPRLTDDERQMIMQRLNTLPRRESLEFVEQRETALSEKRIGRRRTRLSNPFSQPALDAIREVEAAMEQLANTTRSELSH